MRFPVRSHFRLRFIRDGWRILSITFLVGVCSAAFDAKAQTSPAPAKPGAPEAAQARADFLQAMTLGEEGSKPEALRLLAESLRLQPEANPASSLAFELLMEQRANSSLHLRGHTDGILFAAFSPDGTKVVTASSDHTARIWDATTGKLLTPPLRHDDAVLMAEFSPDGTRVVTASEDQTAKVWDVKTGRSIGQPMQEAKEAFDAMDFARFSPDGTLVATGSDNGRGRVWDAKTGLPVSPPFKYHDCLFSINFTSDGTRILNATSSDRAVLMDVKTAKPVLDPLRHLRCVFMAVFDPQETRILTASADHTAKLWDAKTGKPLGPVFRHGSYVFTAYFNQDASRVVTASWDHTARVWDAVTGQPVTPPLQHSDSVSAAVFSPDGARVATASRDHTARVWDASTGAPLTLPLRTSGEVTKALFNHDGSSLLITSPDHDARFVDLPPRENAPAWVADLAEFAASQAPYDDSHKSDLGKMGQLREKLLASTSNDPWDKFGRWYFMESDVRPISPWSPISLKAYVDGLMAAGDKDSLDYAISLSQNQPAWMMQLQSMRAKLDAIAPPLVAGKEKTGNDFKE
jgi:WD40 repeat protein